jgi:hypothetical protein
VSFPERAERPRSRSAGESRELATRRDGVPKPRSVVDVVAPIRIAKERRA